MDAFAQIPWSFTFCCVALGLLAAFRGVSPLLGRMSSRGNSYAAAMLLWLTMFVCMAIIFFVGIVLVGVYERRKTLWAPIALHSLYNFLFAGPVVVLMILNSHAPAKTWSEAKQPPAWLGTRWLPIEKQANAEAQRLHAIDIWGTKGLHLWKQEIRAMEAVCVWFPEDRQACARAREGIAMIFQVYLRDPRRAIVQSDWVLSEYPDQPESCAGAILTKADAYRDIGDDERSREAYSEIIRSYGTIEWARDAAEQGLQELNRQ